MITTLLIALAAPTLGALGGWISAKLFHTKTSRAADELAKAAIELAKTVSAHGDRLDNMAKSLTNDALRKTTQPLSYGRPALRKTT